MFKRLIVVLSGLMLPGFVWFMGCSPASATKPGSALAPPRVAAAQGDVREKPARKTPVSASSSSLDALRQGKAAAPGPLKDVYFDFDRYDLRADARETLKENAQWLKANPSVRVEIEGHGDERGTNEYNLALGAKRAQTAKQYLQSLGISEKRLSTKSYGEEAPVCREHTEECWQRNRHDRFVVIPGRPTS